MDMLNSDKHVIECKKRCGDVCCVYLLVIQIDRFTEEKRGILEQLDEALGEIREKTIVLFTSGEQLTNNTFDEFIKEADSHLK
ncbi:hypothetical protein J4Q44_G00140650 [Coregonus suidteri]|uniref:AIG1-type G domain-containing protein n=1 Tax=Coregonus suidteri TaxID=861788 RepID=A0AAN8M916_9TELE